MHHEPHALTPEWQERIISWAASLMEVSKQEWTDNDNYKTTVQLIAGGMMLETARVQKPQGTPQGEIENT